MSAKQPTDLAKLERKKFDDAIGKESDPVILVLRAHLFSEGLLERLIRLRLPRGDKVLENGNLSFAQKLSLVDALDVISDAVSSSLRNLNRLRNQCAHELGRTITDSDVVRIGSPLGKFFTSAHRDANYNSVATLRLVISYMCGYVTGVCHSIEEDAHSTDKNDASEPTDSTREEDAA